MFFVFVILFFVFNLFALNRLIFVADQLGARYRIVTGQIGKDMIEPVARRIHLVNRSVVDFASFVDHHHAIGHRGDFLKNVSRKENRFFLTQSRHRLTHATNLIRIKSRSRFVENQNFRFVDQRLSHPNALTVTFGKFVDRLVDHATEGTDVDNFFDAIAFRFLVHAAGFGEEVQQAIRSHLWIKRTRFWKVAKVPGTREAIMAHVVPRDLCHSSRRR